MKQSFDPVKQTIIDLIPVAILALAIIVMHILQKIYLG
jgi:hypothetical protein